MYSRGIKSYRISYYFYITPGIKLLLIANFDGCVFPPNTFFMYSRGIKSYRISFDFYITPGIKLLLIANFAVFILEVLLYRFSGVPAYAELVKWFGLVPAGVIPGLRIWQPF